MRFVQRCESAGGSGEGARVGGLPVSWKRLGISGEGLLERVFCGELFSFSLYAALFRRGVRGFVCW